MAQWLGQDGCLRDIKYSVMIQRSRVQTLVGLNFLHEEPQAVLLAF